jgi:hypothetical protein
MILVDAIIQIRAISSSSKRNGSAWEVGAVSGLPSALNERLQIMTKPYLHLILPSTLILYFCPLFVQLAQTRNKHCLEITWHGPCYLKLLYSLLKPSHKINLTKYISKLYLWISFSKIAYLWLGFSKALKGRTCVRFLSNV